MNEEKPTAPAETPEVLPPDEKGAGSEFLAMAALADSIVGPFTEAQKFAAKAALDVAREQAASKERIFARTLSAPLVWAMCFGAMAMTAYLFHLGKEAAVLDLAKVMIGGLLGYFAGRKGGVTTS